MTDAKRILIVEDEEIIMADIARTLRAQGYDVAGTAASGAAAVQAAAASRPDLVLMDVRLQGRIDGIEAARLIRQQSEVPILFVTAYSGALSLDLDQLPGRHGSIAKPFSPSELRRAIEAILHTR